MGWPVALSVVLLLQIVAIVESADAPRVKRVLILHSFGRDFAPFSAASAGFRTELARQSPAPIEFLEASLETARFIEGGAESPFVEYLRALFADRPPDLLVPFGAPAMNFLQRHRASLFPDVPMLASALDQRLLKDVNLGANATAVSVRLDIPGIVNNILHLLADTKSIAVVIGDSPLEKFWLTELRQEFKLFTDRVQFDWLNELPFESMRKRLAALPPNSVIFYAVLLVDTAGVPHEQERALEILHSEANAPIFGAFDSQLGRGIVGGRLYPTQEVSRESVRLALRILAGELPSSMQPLSLGPGTPVYDWRELKRWRISESRLPAGSLVRFRPPSVWEQYRWYIIGTLILIAIQTAIIVDLLLHRARRRRAETELRENHQFMELATKAGKMGLWMRDLEKGETWANAHLRALFGFSQTDAIRFDDVLSRIHPYDRGRLALDVEQAEKTELPFEGEFRAILPDGSERWVITRGETVKQPPGRGMRRFGTVIDITERKQAEVALRESEERFRTLADTAPVMIWMSGPDKLCTFFNKGWLDFTGRSTKEELGDGWVEGVHPEDFDRCLGIYTGSFEARQEFTMEYRLRKYDGEYRYVLDTGVPRFEPDGRFLGYIGSAIDITERKRAEERFRLAVEASPSAIVMVNQHGEILLVNTLTERLFGYSREELIGKPVEILVPERFRNEHPAHRAEFFAAPQARAMGAGRDLFARRKDGSEFQVEIGLNPIQTDEGTLVLTAIVDITERKRAESELRLNREELAHVARVSTMGELAASLAHEISQPLGAILRNAEAAEMFLQSSRPDLQEVAAILADIRKDDHRAGEVIDRMRALLKRREFQWSDLDLNALAEEVASLVRPDSEARKVKLALHLAPTVLPVRGDRIQLQQVLLNLLLNAMDAMNDSAPEERRVSVRTQLVDGKAEVAVSDVGHGITSENLERLFEPFFTTKSTGMGMGLAISQTIIGVHGGRIAAENNPDAGATFKLTLPMSDEGRRTRVER